MKRLILIILTLALMISALAEGDLGTVDSYDVALKWIKQAYGYKEPKNIEMALEGIEEVPTETFYRQYKIWLTAVKLIHEANYSRFALTDINEFDLRKLADARTRLSMLFDDQAFAEELKNRDLPLPEQIDTYIAGLYNQRLGKTEEAINNFKSIKGLFDADDRVISLEQCAQDSIYGTGKQLFADGKYWQAYEEYKKLDDFYVSPEGLFGFMLVDEALSMHKKTHSYIPATCDKPATCPECGDTQGEPLGHEYAPATCTQPRTCVRCGATEGEPLGHDAVGADCVTRAVCKRCGETVGGFGEHQWTEATCTVPKTCRICGATEGYAKGHTEVTIKGRKANCLQEGLTDGKICSVCGAVIEEQKPIPTLPHTGITVEGKAATCTEAGLTDGIICSFCGILIKEQKTIAALGHNWQPATYERPETCSRCGLTRGEKLKPKLAVGDIVTYGAYPQTASGTDNTPMEWLVLDVQDEKALLISKYGLDCKPYNTKNTDVTWETCTLRTWLKYDFINRAFTAQEQQAILTTNVDNSRSQGYSGWDTNGGNNTQDKIFLLSYAEANKYLYVTRENGNNYRSRTSPTAYAKNQGAYTISDCKTNEGAAACRWWLRSPGGRQGSAADVDYDGSLYSNYVNYTYNAVRPAFWINLNTAGLG